MTGWLLRFDLLERSPEDSTVTDVADQADGYIRIRALLRAWPANLRNVYLVDPQGNTRVDLSREEAEAMAKNRAERELRSEQSKLVS